MLQKFFFIVLFFIIDKMSLRLNDMALQAG